MNKQSKSEGKIICVISGLEAKVGFSLIGESLLHRSDFAVLAAMSKRLGYEVGKSDGGMLFGDMFDGLREKYGDNFSKIHKVYIPETDSYALIT